MRYELRVGIKCGLSAANRRVIERAVAEHGLTHNSLGETTSAKMKAQHAARALSKVPGVKCVQVRWMFTTAEGEWINGRKRR